MKRLIGFFFFLTIASEGAPKCGLSSDSLKTDVRLIDSVMKARRPLTAADSLNIKFQMIEYKLLNKPK